MSSPLYTLPPASIEQQRIISLIELNTNVIVRSVAGSGKTTSVLHIARSFPLKNVLFLTYSAKLKLETRERAARVDATNIEVHSYHSFAVKYYNSDCFTDMGLKRMFAQAAPQLPPPLPRRSSGALPPQFDLVVVDEAQDMTFLYYDVVSKLLFRDYVATDAILCVIGDEHQSIFEFNGGDGRFLTLAEQTRLASINSFPWEKCQLSQSFRITHEMSLFINKCMFPKHLCDRISSSKRGNCKPRYIVCNTFANTTLWTLEELKFLLQDCGYEPKDIFVLAPSLRSSTTPARYLENRFKSQFPHLPVYVPTSDTEKVDSDVTKNKLIFCTFHQSKGLERKACIVMGFDKSYFDYFKRDTNDDSKCPNELYVATTRASERLTLIHHNQNAHLPFIDKDALSLFADVFERQPLQPRHCKPSKPKALSVSDLLRHIRDDVLTECVDRLHLSVVHDVSSEKDTICIPTIVPCSISGDALESVSEITGTAIPAMYELLMTGKMTILDQLPHLPPVNCPERTVTNIYQRMHKRDIISTTNSELSTTPRWLSIERLLEIANCYVSGQTGFVYRLSQITKHDWMTETDLSRCLERMRLLGINESARFEVVAKCKNKYLPKTHEFLAGAIDCVSGSQVYEFKCVNALSKDHILQLAVYKHLLDDFEVSSAPREYLLYNILTNEMVRMDCDADTLREIVDKLVVAKFGGHCFLDTNDFLRRANNSTY